jgi:flagellar hook assembly protein FlgD
VDDVLLIRYRFGSPGLRARILVVDPRGRLVRVIAPGELLGTEGFYTWDGTDREGRRARTGLYLVLAEVNGPAKETRRYRKTCVLATGR